MYDAHNQQNGLSGAYTPLPGVSGALHAKMAVFPMQPGLMQRGFEFDPFGGTHNVETNIGQNVPLDNGTTLPATNPGEFFSVDSQQDFTLPRVKPEFAVDASGLPGVLNDAYPSITHNIGIAPGSQFDV